MRRSILMSVLAIGAAIAIVTGASTFATFSDQATVNSATLTAGKVDITVNGGENVTATIAGYTCDMGGSASNFAYGQTCTFDITTANKASPNSTLSVVLTTNFPGTVTESVAGCFSKSFPLQAGVAEGGDLDVDLDPGQNVVTTLTVKLDGHVGSENDCQGASISLAFTVTGTQSPTPHD